MASSVNPSDPADRITPVDLSMLGVEAQNTQNAQNITQILPNAASVNKSVSDFQNISAARSALTEVVDTLSSSQVSSGSVAAPKEVNLMASSYVTEAQQQALAAAQALTDLKNATTVDEMNRAYNALKTAEAAAKQAAALSGNDPDALTAAASASASLVSGTKIFDAINQAINAQKLATTAYQSMTTIDTNMAQVNKDFQVIQQSLTTIQQAVTDSGNHPLANAALTTTEQTSTDAQTFKTNIDILSNAVAASAAIAKTFNPNDNINTLTTKRDQIREQLVIAQGIYGLYSNSPIANAAMVQIQDDLKQFDEVIAAAGEVISGIISGGSSASGSQVGATQSTVSFGINVNLMETDNVTSQILMNGFRQMIRQFHEDSPNYRSLLQGIVDKLNLETFVAKRDNTQYNAAVKGFETLKEKLSGIAKEGKVTAQMRNRALTDIMTTIAAANVAGGGLTPTFGTTFNQILNFGSGFAGPNKASSLSGFVDNLNSMNKMYAHLKPAAKSLMSSALTEVNKSPLVSKTALQKSDKSGKAPVPNRGLISGAKTMGELAGMVYVFGKMTELSRANPKASLKEIKDKLVVDIQKAPDLNYPHMQLAKDGANNLVGKLTEEFIKSNRMSSEAAKNRFEIPPFFVQQFYINVASFCPYLRG